MVGGYWIPRGYQLGEELPPPPYSEEEEEESIPPPPPEEPEEAPVTAAVLQRLLAQERARAAEEERKREAHRREEQDAKRRWELAEESACEARRNTALTIDTEIAKAERKLEAHRKIFGERSTETMIARIAELKKGKEYWPRELERRQAAAAAHAQYEATRMGYRYRARSPLRYSLQALRRPSARWL